MKPNTLVKFDYTNVPSEVHHYYLKIFDFNEAFLYMGDISQMDGHCVLCSLKTGKILTGYNTENFIALTEDEL